MISQRIYQVMGVGPSALRPTTASLIHAKLLSPVPVFLLSPARFLANHRYSSRLSRIDGCVPVCYLIPKRLLIPRNLLQHCHCAFAERGSGSARSENEISSLSSSSTISSTRTNPSVGQENPSQPPKPPKKEPFKKVNNYVFSKFFSFVQGYQSIMEKRFPQVMQVYRVFVVGFKDFSKELAEYVKIKTKALLSSDGVLKLNRNELDVYYRMPSEIFRVGPTLILSALPGFQYIIFPIAYKFPKTMLSSHFWSLQQKAEFAIEFQKKRLFNQRPVLRHLQSSMDSVMDEKLRDICRDVLLKLGSGSQPTVREIMKIRPLFESHPFSIKAMHGPHIKSLCRLHGLHTLFLSRRRLFDRAAMLYVMDLSLIKEGIFSLKTDDLKSACFLRGLNAANTKNEDMVEFLQQWASVSSSMQPHAYSLLLHLPVLLAYNNPNNWALLS